MRWDFWQRAGAFLRADTRVLFVGEKPDPRFPLAPQDGPFDLVLQYQVPYDLEKVYGLLKPGGFFLTQQVGGLFPTYNLENQLPLFPQAGFRVVYADQSYEEDKHRFMVIAGRGKST